MQKNKEEYSFVPGTILWNSSKNSTILYNFGLDLFAAPGYDNVKNNGVHEFINVLDVFDAYCYSEHLGIFGKVLFPEARASRTAPNGVMRSPNGIPQTVSDTEISMILYAWLLNGLQVYEDSVLGTTSQAFFH